MTRMVGDWRTSTGSVLGMQLFHSEGVATFVREAGPSGVGEHTVLNPYVDRRFAGRVVVGPAHLRGEGRNAVVDVFVGEAGAALNGTLQFDGENERKPFGACRADTFAGAPKYAGSERWARLDSVERLPDGRVKAVLTVQNLHDYRGSIGVEEFMILEGGARPLESGRFMRPDGDEQPFPNLALDLAMCETGQIAFYFKNLPAGASRLVYKNLFGRASWPLPATVQEAPEPPQAPPPGRATGGAPPGGATDPGGRPWGGGSTGGGPASPGSPPAPTVPPPGPTRTPEPAPHPAPMAYHSLRKFDVRLDGVQAARDAERLDVFLTLKNATQQPQYVPSGTLTVGLEDTEGVGKQNGQVLRATPEGQVQFASTPVIQPGRELKVKFSFHPDAGATPAKVFVTEGGKTAEFPAR